MTPIINTYLIDFHNGKVRECVTENEDGSYTVFVDAALSRSEQLEAYYHAVQHIKRDDFNSNKSVGQIENECHGEGKQ